MTKTSAQLTITLLIFLISIIHAISYVHNKGSAQQQSNVADVAHQDAQKLHLSIPNASWEPIFFKSLETRIKQINLPSLRAIVLPNKDDLEVRFWIDLLPSKLDGVILRRLNNEWSAIRIQGTSERQGFPLSQKQLAVPKSGWDGAWKKLLGAGVMTLPDASEVNCNVIMIDGLAFVIETNFNWSYRTYAYGSPQIAKCNEAKQIISIAQIIFDEFALV